MTRPVRFAVLGCGVIGAVHAEAVAGLADAELVAVADDVRERADALAGKFGVAAHGSIGDLLSRDDLDVVTVCTPSGMHGDAAIEIMRSGRHVIVEKPMEITLSKIDEMLRVQAEAGVKLSVVSQHRWDPASMRVHELVREGALGRLVMANAGILWWRTQRYYERAGWRGTWAMDGGGVLMNQSIHSIDLLCWLAGPVRSVEAYTGTLAHTIETEDTATAALQFESGALGTISATTGAFPGTTTRIEIFGDAGSAVIENDRLSFLYLARDHAPEDVPDYGLSPQKARSEGAEPAHDGNAPPASTHALQFADMIGAIRTGGTPLVDGHAARHPVEVILAIYRSAREGRAVQLPLADEAGMP